MIDVLQTSCRSKSSLAVLCALLDIQHMHLPPELTRQQAPSWRQLLATSRTAFQQIRQFVGTCYVACLLDYLIRMDHMQVKLAGAVKLSFNARELQVLQCCGGSRSKTDNAAADLKGALDEACRHCNSLGKRQSCAQLISPQPHVVRCIKQETPSWPQRCGLLALAWTPIKQARMGSI
jgi:hypothetical protein